MSHRRKRTTRVIVELTASLVLIGLLAAVLLHYDAAFASPPDGLGHWRSGERAVVVVDKTGDRGWWRATRSAVERWNAAGADIRLSWTTGTGPCQADSGRIEVCLRSDRELTALGVPDVEGIANPDQDTAVEHTKGGVIVVCSDCGADKVRRRVIATHEIGHTLGLMHTDRPSSVMFHTGGSSSPDADDRRALQELYAHQDGPPRCGVFDVRLMGVCV